MGEKISGYADDATSKPIQVQDYLDFSNYNGGPYDVSKKILLSELITFLNANGQNIYVTDGTLTGNRTMTHSTNWLKHLGGDVILEMNNELDDYAFIINGSGSVEQGRFGYDQITQSAILELQDISGVWFNANDNQIVQGGSTPLANVMYDFQFPNGSTTPIAFWEQNPAGASVGENYSISFYFNDDTITRTLGGSITARVGLAPTTGDVNMDLVLHGHLKIQYNDRVLITPAVTSKAAVAHLEVRGEIGVTANINFLSKANGDGISNETFRGQSESGDISVILSANGRCQFNRSGNSGGDFQIEGVSNANLFYTDASADGIGVGTNVPNASAIMEWNSTTKGIRLVPMTVAQAGAITPVDGLMVHVSDTDATFPIIGLYARENGVWNKL